MGIEIIPAAFTDHYAVAMRITVQDTDLQRQMEDGLHTDNRWTSQKKDKL